MRGRRRPPLDVVHTFPKVKALSKKFNFDKTLQFFSGNQSCQPLKSANPQHFHEFLLSFTLKFENWSGNLFQINLDFEEKMYYISPFYTGK